MNPVKELTILEIAQELSSIINSIDALIGDPVHPNHKQETYLDLAVKLVPHVDNERLDELQERVAKELEPHQSVHEYGDSYTGMLCGTLVLDKDGYGDQCGLPAKHPVHRLQAS